MNEDLNKEFRLKLIETFRAFDAFCKRHQIQYYTAGGTLIGAVRHQGLIPWDDDVDVWMLRKDYERFLTFRGQVEGHYDIMDSRDENYWLLSLAKFVDTDTTLWEFEHYPCITGVYIDIFPLDECDADKAMALRKEYDETSFKLTYAMAKHSMSQFLTLLAHRDLGTFVRYLKDSLYYRPGYKKYLQEYEACVQKIKSSKGDMYVAFDGLYQEREIYKKEWLAEIVKLPFEDMEVDAPAGYHEILTQVYGDYMQLPPVEKRVSHHSHYFMDLHRRWTIDEIRAFKKRHR
jgi:lipopolysaccharide cholinephosphotransferase